MGEAEPVKCPFCGAPYREIVPPDVVQVKCNYCGGVFHVPPAIGTEVPRCVNHPEKVAIGMCNDCGRSFCGNCLHSYRLATRGESATLYLCPDCLKARYDKKVQGYIAIGAMMLLMGVFFMIAAPLPGMLVLVFGLASLFYGVTSRPGALQESTVDELKSEQEKREAELSGSEGVDSDAMYDELVIQYENRWGPGLGIQLLDDEINACMRHGQSFPEALAEVYRRQQKKSTNQKSSYRRNASASK